MDILQKKKVTLIANGKFHFFNIAKILSKNDLLLFFYNNDKYHFKSKNTKKYIKFDYVSFFLNILIRYFNFKLSKLNHQSFPFNYKFDENNIYVASLSYFSLINTLKDKNIKVIIDHASPNLEYDKKIILRELKKYSLDFNLIEKDLVDNWAINQLNYEFTNASSIHVPSSFVKKTFRNKNYHSKIVINNISANLEKVRHLKQLNNDLNIIYVGDFSLRKGVHRMILALCKAHKINIKLNLVGGKFEDHIMYDELKKALKLNKNIELISHGKLSKNKLLKIYKLSNLMIFPSLCDGYGLVVNEAISNGMPVICSIYAGASDIIRKYNMGYTYNPYIEESLIKKIQKITKKENYQRLTHNITEFSNQIEIIEKKYADKIINNLK